MKFLLWGLVGFIVVLWLLHGKKARVGKSSPVPEAEIKTLSTESMVRCDHCGVHFPASEALHGPAEAVFCSDEHRRRHAVR